MCSSSAFSNALNFGTGCESTQDGCEYEKLLLTSLENARYPSKESSCNLLPKQGSASDDERKTLWDELSRGVEKSRLLVVHLTKGDEGKL